MGQINDTTLKALTLSLRSEFNEGLKKKAPTWGKIAMRIPSSTATNMYSWMKGMPMMQEWIGKRVIHELNKDGLVITNKTFEATVGVPRTDFEDDQLGQYRVVSRQLGENAAKLPDQLVWKLLEEGVTNRCYDGQCFFDAEHPLYSNADGTGNTTFQSNLTKGNDDVPTWYVIDDSGTYMPIIWQERQAPEIEAKFSTNVEMVFMQDIYPYGARARGNAGYGFWQLAHAAVKTPLNGENLAAVIEKMKKLKTDGDQHLDIRPTTLIVPPQLEVAATKLLEAKIIDSTSNVWAGKLALHVESRLS